MKHAFVVDTNVLHVANGQASHASDACRQACIDYLESITDGTAIIVVDSGGEVLSEYLRARTQGQPGVGDRFILWLFNVLGNGVHCERVIISAAHEQERAWEEFPADPALSGFDRDDQKFVAVARASGNSPTIVNAVDSDWATYSGAIRASGLDLLCLCPDVVAC